MSNSPCEAPQVLWQLTKDNASLKRQHWLQGKPVKTAGTEGRHGYNTPGEHTTGDFTALPK